MDKKDKKEMEKGLKRNNINKDNIKLFFESIKKMEKLGFDDYEYNEMDGRFYITFSIEN